MKKITAIICLSAFALFWAGCQNAGRPTPEMTRMGMGTGPGSDGGGVASNVDNAGSGNLGDFEYGDENLQSRTSDVSGVNGPAYASVYFDYDRSYVRESERAILNETAKYLLQNSGQRVLIEGHCDWKGTTDYNLALGDRRANSVKSYLVELGVSPSSIDVLSKGDLDANEGADDAGRQLDRRGDIILIP
ncbi:OmpA family protein [Opitutia bacterium ISCC 51]|nr:OmpA family protein [Opitutae bacterium ISCC 51]QXD30063.1 OmpA family protein [Opitutae bacterium ISCC 52]